jgi:hypothetical protein
MKGITINLLLLVAVFSASGSYGAAKQYEKGRIITVEKKFHERVLYYLVNTPVTQDDPYFEVSLLQGNTVLQTEFTPRHAADTLPEGWQDDAEVEMKITDKHHVLVRQQGGTELQLVIVKRTPGAEQSTDPKPASPKN